MNHEDTNLTANRKYKDTMFRMIFKDKKELLSLYNAVNGSHHKNAEDLQIVTLKNAIYMTIKNDLAFLIDFHLYLYEHQSTYNPNLPLRSLFYIASEYRKLTDNRSIYSSAMVSIPAPKFIVFYNGIQKLPETLLLKLSDSYYTTETDPQLELKVTILNINSGNNQHILDKCPTLKEYMLYIECIRKYLTIPDMPLESAVEYAIQECIRKNILADFLLANRSEAVNMNIFEFDEREKQLLREADFDFGTEIGLKLVDTLIKIGKSDDIPKVIADSEYRKKLIREYNLLPFYL